MKSIFKLTTHPHIAYRAVFGLMTNQVKLPGATYLKYTYNHRTLFQHGHNVAHSFWQHMSIHLSLGCSTPQ